MHAPVLLLDVGNTRVHLALSAPNLWRRLDVAHQQLQRFPERVGEWLLGARPAVIAISSVHDDAARSILAALPQASAQVVSFRSHADLPLAAMHVRSPHTVGMDRLMNVLGARVQAPGAHVVLDFGTALTLSVLDASDGFLGGAIAPGRALMARALHQGTAALPEVDATADCPPAPIGKDTRAAIAAGLWHGLIGAARELIRGALAQPGLAAATVWATGGDAERVAPALAEVTRIDRDLTLKGIRHALEWRLGR
ncbi:MAG: type III pantothenate kinase [Planctomycetota bacterium]